MNVHFDRIPGWLFDDADIELPHRHRNGGGRPGLVADGVVRLRFVAQPENQ